MAGRVMDSEQIDHPVDVQITLERLSGSLGSLTRRIADAENDISEARGAPIRIVSAAGVLIIALVSAIVVYITQGTNGQVAPLMATVGTLTTLVSNQSTEIAVLLQKNVEVETQFRCQETVRELQFAYDQQWKALTAIGAIKMPSATAFPAMDFHAACQSTSSQK